MAGYELPQVPSAAGTAGFRSRIRADLTSPGSLDEAQASWFYFSAKPSLTKDTVLGSCSNFPDIDFLFALPPLVSMPCFKKSPLSVPGTQRIASDKLSSMWNGPAHLVRLKLMTARSNSSNGTKSHPVFSAIKSFSALLQNGTDGGCWSLASPVSIKSPTQLRGRMGCIFVQISYPK